MSIKKIAMKGNHVLLLEIWICKCNHNRNWDNNIQFTCILIIFWASKPPKNDTFNNQNLTHSVQ